MRYFFDTNIPLCAGYETQINLDLLNATADLISSTTESAKQVSEIRRSLRRMPWYESMNSADFFAPYGIRYLGELLERYAEKLGDTLPNTRAIALAMAFTASILTPNMFIGKQRKNFIHTLAKMASKDIYLLYALSRLAPDEEKRQWESRVITYACERTEEAIFLLCTVDESVASFDLLFPGVESLFTQQRTLPVIGNAAIYGWVLARNADIIKTCRKKNLAVIKALFALEKGYVRENNPAYATLLNAGYSARDILYLNSMFIWDECTRYDHISPDSIPAERMATALATSVINDPNGVDPCVLEYVAWLFNRYSRLNIKFEGNESLAQAIAPVLDITCPETLIWAVRQLDWKQTYLFDPLDRKWDVLARELSPKKYHELFRQQLLRQSNAPKEVIEAMLARYRELTDQNYLSLFDQYRYDETDVFSFLVSKDVIDLWTFFERIRNLREETGEDSCLRYVWNKAAGVNNRQAFDFWKCFFEHYSMYDFRSFFSCENFHEQFFSHRNYYYSERVLRYERDFLTREENCLLYEWIDESVFIFDPEKYCLCVSSFLHAKETSKLFDLSELRPIYDILRASEDSKYVRDLSNLFLSAEELEEEKQRKKAEALAQEQRKMEEERKRVIDEMDEAFDGTFHSIHKYLNRFYFSWREKKVACEHASTLLQGLLKERRTLPRREYGMLIGILSDLVRHGSMNRDAVIHTLSEIAMNEEEEANKKC